MRISLFDTIGGGALLLVLAVLSACDTADEADSQTQAQEPELVIRLANELKPSDKIWAGSRLFKEALERESPDGRIDAGEIEVVLYDQGSVGSESQLLENTYFGALQVAQVNSSVVALVDPAYSLLNLPYLFTSGDHQKRVINGPIGDTLLKRLQRENLRGLAFFGAGLRNYFYKPLSDGECAQTASDLQGMKIRVMQNPIMIKTINAMGASSTPIAFSALFQSIRTGVVDGAENSAQIYLSNQYYEAGATCFTRTEHVADQHVLVANDDWLQSLQPKYRQRILQVAEQIVPKYNQIWTEATTQALEDMKDQGVTVNRIDKEAFLPRVRPVHEQFLQAQPDEVRALYNRIQDSADQSP